MSLQTLAFLLGCGLIVIAIVGGGIEAKEVKVPKLSAIPRLLSAVFGIGLVFGAVGGLSSHTGGPPDASAANAAPVAALANSAAPVAPPTVAPAATLPPVVEGPAANAAAPVVAPSPPPAPAEVGMRTVRISDSLGPEQQYERIQVIIRGRQVGLIALDSSHRQQTFDVEVREGDEYTLVGSEASLEEDGSVRTRTISGGGTFDGEHASYILWSDTHSAEIRQAELRGQ